jgi:AhpD family alkylhydroperoxidase
MPSELYPSVGKELIGTRNDLSPDLQAAFQAFQQRAFADGELPEKTKQLIAVAVAHVTQCPYCIKEHTRAAVRSGATNSEIMEAIWVAAEMRAGAAIAHSLLAVETMLGGGKSK